MSKFQHSDLKGMHEKEPRKDNYTGIYSPEYFWEDCGKVYASTFNEKTLTLNTKHLISRIKELKVETVLEVGCGFGRNLPYIAENIPHIKRLVGLEFSKTMIKSSKDYFKLFEKNYNIDIVNANVKDIPFKDNEFDLIYTHVCLTHIPPKDIARATSEISRVAKNWIIHFERWKFLNEHPNNHRWSHNLVPHYIDLGWELHENDVINGKHHTNVIVFKKL